MASVKPEMPPVAYAVENKIGKQFFIRLAIISIVFLLNFFQPKQVLAVTSISTCVGLQDMQSDPTADYELSTDIDCTYDTQNPSGALYNSGAGFDPVTDFSGSLNGNSHTITGLFINRPATDYVGLFGGPVTVSYTVTNVGLINADVTGHNTVGTLGAIVAGSLSGQNVSNSYATGSVSGNSSVGGLMGSMGAPASSDHAGVDVTCTSNDCGGLFGVSYNYTYTNLYATGSVTQTGAAGTLRTGGLMGLLGGPISSCYSTGNVSGVGTVGGAFGLVAGTVSQCYATGTVTAGVGGEAGGLAGEADKDISESYATGAVSGGDINGGLVGYQTGGTIANSYARGSVSGGSYIGGLVGANTGDINTSFATGLVTASSTPHGGLNAFVISGTFSFDYWDKNTTGETTSAGSDSSYGKTTSEMKTQGTFSTWDFSTIWNIDSTLSINNGYPYLRWESHPTPSPSSTPTSQSSISPAGPPDTGCGLQAPTYAPNLFAANRKGNKVTLRFTAVNGSTGYAIIYGYYPGDDHFGVNFDVSNNYGVLSYEIAHLDSKRSYTFKIQALNSCAVGPWSDYLTVDALGNSTRSTPLPVPLPVVTPTPEPFISPTLAPTPGASTSGELINATGSGIIDTINQIGEIINTTVSNVVVTVVEHKEELAAATDTGVTAGSTVVAVVVGFKAAGTAVTVAKTLYTVYQETAKPMYIMPISFMESVGQGVWQMFMGLLAPLLGLLKKKSGRGKVFDGSNGKPVGAAYIVLFSSSGNLSTDFTDPLGQYELKPKPDVYGLKVEKSMYSFPSRLIAVRHSIGFSRIYVPGEKFEIKASGERLNNVSVPIDPVKLDSFLNRFFAKLWNIATSLFAMAIPILATLMIVTSGLAAVTHPVFHYTFIFVTVTILVVLYYLSKIIAAKVLEKS